MNRYFVSALVTFLSMFLVVLGGSLLTVGAADWNSAVVLGLVLSAFRTALKGAVETFVGKPI